MKRNKQHLTALQGRGVNRTNSLDKIQQQLMMYEMQKIPNNKDIEQYHCLFSEYKTAKTGLIKKQKGAINPKNLKISVTV